MCLIYSLFLFIIFNNNFNYGHEFFELNNVKNKQIFHVYNPINCESMLNFSFYNGTELNLISLNNIKTKNKDSMDTHYYNFIKCTLGIAVKDKRTLITFQRMTELSLDAKEICDLYNFKSKTIKVCFKNLS
jgi:hypothetical protein